MKYSHRQVHKRGRSQGIDNFDLQPLIEQRGKVEQRTDVLRTFLARYLHLSTMQLSPRNPNWKRSFLVWTVYFIPQFPQSLQQIGIWASTQRLWIRRGQRNRLGRKGANSKQYAQNGACIANIKHTVRG